MPGQATRIGVAIVAFESAGFIHECLSSLIASDGVELRVVVVDNASTDASCDAIRQWAASHAGQVDFAEAETGTITHSDSWLTLLRNPVNAGFAHACNRALELLMADPAIDLFWLLNPDGQVQADTARHYARAGADGPFALMGGRTLFAHDPGTVQTDGGRVSRWTGVCHSVNLGCPLATTPPPAARTLDFITGANCVASRRFLEQAGLMEEGYFLYYEEVDWAMRRGHLPLIFVADAAILHRGGTAIGTGSHIRRPSPFANYFNYRNRMRFMARFHAFALPVVLLFGLAKAGQLALMGAWGEADAALRGLLGLAPPAAVRHRLSSDAQAVAFQAGARCV